MKTKYPKDAGIYKLTCVNGKLYIGKAVNLNKRLNRHKNSLKDVKGTSFLQNAIRKYGWESFDVEILEIFTTFDKVKDKGMLLEREAYYINLYETTDRNKGYNLCKFSNDVTGIPMSEETKEKKRKFRHSEETKERIRQTMLGRTHSKESIEKMKKPKSKEHAENIRKAMLGNPNLAWIGRKHSDETKEKIRKSKIKRNDRQ